jgi:hypothetical protein
MGGRGQWRPDFAGEQRNRIGLSNHAATVLRIFNKQEPEWSLK